MRHIRAFLVTTALAAIAAVGLTSCAPTPAAPTGAGATGAADVATILDARGWGGLTGNELVETLEALPVAERPDDLMASVTASAVTLTAADGSTRVLELDAFYLSVAPYVSQTHPCGFHSLTTCRGELASALVTLTVTDAGTGEVVAEHDGQMNDNGFAGLWLPRDRELEVVAVSGGGEARTAVRTGADDPTCLTTMQLS